MGKEQEKQIARAFLIWNNEKEGIAQLFRMRKKQAAAEPMKSLIGNFVNALFLVNDETYGMIENLQEELIKLPYKPINCLERLEFIRKEPTNYHSFIQLAQLYDELLKLYQKKVVMLQNKTRNADT